MVNVDIVPGVGLVYTDTGEALAFDASTGELATALDRISEYESQLRELRSIISRVITSRMDEALSWTLREGGWVITASTPQAHSQFDEAALSDVLVALYDAGTISGAQHDACWRVKTTREPDAGAIRRLCTISPVIAVAVNGTRVEKAQARRVGIKRE